MFFFFQAEDGIRDLVRSRGLGDVYKRQVLRMTNKANRIISDLFGAFMGDPRLLPPQYQARACLLYTSDAADERSSVDLGGRRIIKKNKYTRSLGQRVFQYNKHKKQ